MISPISTTRLATSNWQDHFLSMLPRIRDAVHRAFRHLPGDRREEAIHEAVANACVRFARLAERGHEHRAFPTVLARFAVAQVRDGRRVGTRCNRRDLCFVARARAPRSLMEQHHRPVRQEGRWEEAMVEDRRTAIPDQAGFRIDFPAWLSRLPGRDRQVAEALALGHSTTDVACRFRVSAARVAQLRREFHDSWQQFHGEPFITPFHRPTSASLGTPLLGSRATAKSSQGGP